MARIAIRGFGRIGRSLMKVALKNRLFTPVSVSDIKDLPTLAALFEVDTNYGRWHEEVKTNEQGFVIGGRAVAYYDSIKELPDWRALGVDLVIDCTGRATTRAGAQPHLDRGAGRVLVSAPARRAMIATRSCFPASISKRSTRNNTRSSVWRAAPPTRSRRWSRW
jgi:glyceraldehyde 3-phosphate dehydrogenase